ncbi:MAG: hypothetical protein Q7V01_07645, partial [Vicinamibacterales bacterium]|nr:hypothetical protein [Vicinamibacterales bacterium]
VLADTLPGQRFSARVSSLAGAAARGGIFENTAGPLRVFDVGLRLDQPDARLKPGTTVRVTLTGAEARDALTLPRQAIFQKNGKPVIYVRAGAGFSPREITIVNRNESRVAIEGVTEGTEVALVNPEAAASPSAATIVPTGGPAK